jgi:PAS domain S-box-containing protein
MKILIVEDDLGIQELISDTLEEKNYSAEAFDEGEDALERLMRNDVDLIMLDYSLPNMTGEMFILEMNKLNLNRKPEFILMTGRGDERIAVQMMKLGAADYLIKDANFLSNLPRSIFNVVKDIEQKKKLLQVETALIESENKFRYVLENAIAVTYNYNFRKNNFEYISPSVEKVFGVCADYVLKNGLVSIQKLVLEDDLERFRAVFNGTESHESDSTFILEYQIHNSRTGRRWIKDTITVIKDENNSVLSFIGNALDITEQKLMELRIKKSEQKYRNTINSLEDVVHVIDYNFRIKIANKNFYSFLDSSVGDLTNRNIFDVVPYLTQKNRQEYESVFESGKTLLTQEVVKLKDEVKFVEVRKIAVKEDKKVKSIITVIRDITQSKKAEKAVLENQRLGAIGEMASSVAHDFNNSLQAILGYIDLSLLDDNINASLKEYLDTIKKAANDAASRVKILQRFGGYKTNTDNYKCLDINLLIKDVIEQSRPLWKDDAEKKGLLINIKSDCRKVSNIRGNEGELRSVIYNIIKNSIEAMPDGGNIYIKSFEENNNVTINIIDTGMGMDDQTRTRIFQPFYSTKGYKLGRGLGMSGVYSIIQEHMGKIIVKNTEKGKGTTIELTLPVSCKEENNELAKPCDYKISNEMKILWVDDEKNDKRFR